MHRQPYHDEEPKYRVVRQLVEMLPGCRIEWER